MVYELEVGGVRVRVEPPDDGWELLDYSQERSFAGALFAWRGPTGFKSETLDLLVSDVGDSLEEAWTRVEELGARAAAVHDQAWGLVDTGARRLDGVEVEWREFRTPVLPPADAPGFEQFYTVQDFIDDVWGNTSVRFYVVPVDEFTITLMAYESRCA